MERAKCREPRATYRRVSPVISTPHFEQKNKAPRWSHWRLHRCCRTVRTTKSSRSIAVSPSCDAGPRAITSPPPPPARSGRVRSQARHHRIPRQRGSQTRRWARGRSRHATCRAALENRNGARQWLLPTARGKAARPSRCHADLAREPASQLRVFGGLLVSERVKVRAIERRQPLLVLHRPTAGIPRARAIEPVVVQPRQLRVAAAQTFRVIAARVLKKQRGDTLRRARVEGHLVHDPLQISSAQPPTLVGLTLRPTVVAAYIDNENIARNTNRYDDAANRFRRKNLSGSSGTWSCARRPGREQPASSQGPCTSTNVQVISVPGVRSPSITTSSERAFSRS
jgi:hypothetical protein